MYSYARRCSSFFFVVVQRENEVSLCTLYLVQEGRAEWESVFWKLAGSHSLLHPTVTDVGTARPDSCKSLIQLDKSTLVCALKGTKDQAVRLMKGR